MVTQPKALGRYIRGLRLDAGLSLYDVANRTQLNYTHLSRIENDSTVPNPATIARIASVLAGDLAVMLRLADNLPREILDRLNDRVTRTPAPVLNRAMPSGPRGAPGEEASSLDAQIQAAGLDGEEARAMSEAVEGLLSLPSRQRRLILDLISSYFSEGDDPTG